MDYSTKGSSSSAPMDDGQRIWLQPVRNLGISEGVLIRVRPRHRNLLPPHHTAHATSSQTSTTSSTHQLHPNNLSIIKKTVSAHNCSSTSQRPPPTLSVPDYPYDTRSFLSQPPNHQDVFLCLLLPTKLHRAFGNHANFRQERLWRQ